MNIQDVVTSTVQSCGRDTNLASAAKIMWDTDCGVLPVVNVEGQVLGMLRSTVFFCILLSAMLAYSVTPSSATVEERQSHQTISGVVTKVAGGLAIKTPQGTTYQLNENQAKRHGHEPFKEGDQVTFVLDENNSVIDVHPEGQKSAHQYVTGKLIHLGKMQKEIKLATAEGEKVFPLSTLEAKTKGINEGTLVTVEVNEAGTVIDVHRATGGTVKP